MYICIVMIRKNCKTCGRFFWTIPSRIKKGKGKFCSHKCAMEDRKKGEYKKCSYCGGTFYVQKRSLKRKGRGQYCSRDCKDKSQKDRVIKYCKNCNTELHVQKAVHKRGHGNYCSDVCKAKHYWKIGRLSTPYPKTGELRDIVRKRIWGRKAVKNLNDWYCKNKISEQSGLRHKDIPQGVVKFKRVHLKLKRTIKEVKDE